MYRIDITPAGKSMALAYVFLLEAVGCVYFSNVESNLNEMDLGGSLVSEVHIL